MYSSIRSESRRPDVKSHLYILPGSLPRAWDPVFKTAGSAPDAAMILGLFSQKILRFVFIRKNCIRMVFVYFAFWGLQEECSTLPCSPLIRQCALMGHYQNTRIFSCSYFGDIKYFRSRFALAY
jgi:hypothetical protein